MYDSTKLTSFSRAAAFNEPRTAESVSALALPLALALAVSAIFALDRQGKKGFQELFRTAI